MAFPMGDLRERHQHRREHWPWSLKEAKRKWLGEFSPRERGKNCLWAKKKIPWGPQVAGFIFPFSNRLFWVAFFDLPTAVHSWDFTLNLSCFPEETSELLQVEGFRLGDPHVNRFLAWKTPKRYS